MIIPRRELLTGAALVLAGSLSGCATANPQAFRTQFMADFTKKFIGDPTKIKPPGSPDPWPDPASSGDPPRVWPKQGQTQQQISEDYATFVTVLMTAGYVMAPLPTFPPGSLGEQITSFLQTQNWPAAAPVFPVPPPYPEPLPTVHLLEIAVILDRLLQAINSFNSGQGAGGGGSNWPPH